VDWTVLLLWAVAALLVAIGIAGMVLPAIPGPLVVLAGLALAAWIEGFAHVGPGWLAVLTALALLAMLLDVVAGALGARRFGASRRAMWGAALGAVVGIFFGLPGVLLGPFVGAVIGELTARDDIEAAGRAGVGATIGLLLGVAGKLALAFAMIGLFAVVRFL